MNSKSSHPIPWMRTRAQKSGKKYYYFEVPECKARREIPLGSDYTSAMEKRGNLLLTIRLSERSESNDLLFTLQLYIEIVLYTLNKNKLKENLRTCKNLLEFLKVNNFDFHDTALSTFKNQYVLFRESASHERVFSEMAFLKRLHNLAVKWQIVESKS